MSFNGYIKIGAAVPSVKLADCKYNAERIIGMMARAEGMGAEVLCFPELSITGSSCGDLFQQQQLLDEALSALLRIMEFSRNLPEITVIVGLPLATHDVLLNCAAVVTQGKVRGLVPKTYLTNREKRWFSTPSILGAEATFHFCGESVPLGTNILFKQGDFTFGVEIGEDLWSPLPPSSEMAIQGASVLFAPSAFQSLAGSYDYLRNLVLGQSARTITGYICVSSGWGESSQDGVFGGGVTIAENGRILDEGNAFLMDEQLVLSEINISSLHSDRIKSPAFGVSKSLHPKAFRMTESGIHSNRTPNKLTRYINPLPFVPQKDFLGLRCEEILNIQSEGLARRIVHTHARKAVIGISGGLDSTLALLVCVRTFDRIGKDRKDILGITMPGFGTTGRTYNNALELMRRLGITQREISIKEACRKHFADIGHDENLHDATYENSQARERTQLLMDIANQCGGLVVGTGDLSELALGWATYNGDHMSMYGVNASVPKTLIKHIVLWVATHLNDYGCKEILYDITDTPISPELVPAAPDGNISQKTEDLVGPYELHDFFLYHTLRHGTRPTMVYKLACMAFNGIDKRVERYEPAVIKKWLTTFYRRFFAQQFKRSCLPDGPQTGSCTLSPRGGWCMPSDAYADTWLQECDRLE